MITQTQVDASRFLANVVTLSREPTRNNMNFEGKRDLDKECGYPDRITVTEYRQLYDREGIAKRIVSLEPEECWKVNPTVFETDNPETTEFELSLKALVKRFNIWAFLERADVLSGIGHYGVILVGVDDGRPLHIPISGVTDSEYEEIPETIAKEYNLLYLKCFDERLVTITAVNRDQKSSRFGRPEFYNIKMVDFKESENGILGDETEVKVHWTRIIHLADNRETSDIAGQPRLQPVFNRVYDLRKVIGGSGEMFYKGGFPGISFEVMPGLENVEFDKEEFKKEVEEYAHGLSRYLRLIGIKASSLAPQVADPTSHVSVSMDQICLALKVPKRIFMGTESAHLASTQDEKTWMIRVNGRRMNYVGPYIINPFLRRMVMLGILPRVVDFDVTWNDPTEVDPLVRAQVFEKLVNAMSQYVSGGMAGIVPPLEFLTEFLTLPVDKAQQILDAAKKFTSGESTELPVKLLSEEEPEANTNENTTGNGPRAGTGSHQEDRDLSTGQNG